MTQYSFGSGTIIAKRTDVSNIQPALLGVVQGITVDIDQSLVKLWGQSKMPVDIAPSQLSVTGKATFARLQAGTFNNLILNGTQTTAAGFEMTTPEAITVPAVSGPYTVTVAQGATFLTDLGVYYAATGIQLQPSASASAVGIYIPGAASVGTYTFNVADASTALIVYYQYTVTTLVNIALSQQLMGTGPIFAMYMKQAYTVQGVAKTLNMKLNACRSSKMALAFNNQEYTIPDMDFAAFADAAGNWGTWAMTE